MFELTVRQRLAALVLLLFLAIGGFLIYFNDNRGYTEVYRDEAKEERILVHVCGAVMKPGVYSFKPGVRKFEVLKEAGGALPDGDLNRVNLAEFALDGEQVYLPYKGEVLAKSPRKRPVATSAVSNTKNEAHLDQSVKGPYDLNSVTAKELENVPGIGPSLAARIIQYRNEHGKFNLYEDLLKVSGIGTAKLEQFRPYLFVK